MRRFFIEPVADLHYPVVLDREEAHHCLRVLRLQHGAEVELLDGIGGLYRGSIELLGRQVAIRLQEKIAQEPEPAHPVWLFQGDLKGKKMDELVQRCTELGVTRFLPFTSRRSQGRIAGERWARKQQRWRDLVRAACKQSGRLRLMDTAQQRPIGDCLAEELPAATLKLLFWEEEKTRRLTAVDWPAADRLAAVAVMMGPEGGFAEGEVEQARHHGWTSVSLGSGILRAETATIAAVAIVQHRLGAI
ncbi:16S rRNA (uracil(1498)-N(3))-methyltransferase [Desulfofustis glycolicus]|uniref:Ribosomal RNA small subunit methyltransferase E n=1 Tax=Desulfofustis glycolicus DSM 9705 TaxID=1121409 RepID=A0A1M5WK07_9BACT|nr:16S rRNA (uracil(1498)-N(3))-methyltransferase [Desulfofustis glycolicus]MCB2216814.1 16S rRNA (uracil(1498)-N(3))-methyltransferase [Desulfobulbaceae bacterium]SHH87514.1 16S rRNA (uracil1498-N3)-methyltransferase [Desulfofustis glycolicus DSM 9705]